MSQSVSTAKNKKSREVNLERLLVLVFALFLLCVGLFYSGRLYLSHLNDGIAAGVVVDGLVHMLPGDHHEQFYRYSLVYENLLRGRLPYYTGYQYASTDFTEGLVFFPFTAIVGLASFVFGPILSYNLLLLSSYVFVGLAGYYMIRQVTNSTAAGIVAGVFLATVPFRTSFLYGQMVYGVDAVLLPLLIYVVERAKETHRATHFFLVGVIMFLTITANFQLFYWVMFLLSPYFICVFIGYLRSVDGGVAIKLKAAAWLLPGLLGCLAYGLYVYALMKGSALQGGQSFDETLFYTPEPHRLFIKFNGNEKNIYLGLTAMFVMPWLFYPLLRYRKAKARSPYIPLFLMLFLVGMFLVFGPIIDRALKLQIYQWMFEHIPGFNGTRTPGRIMAVVVVFYAILLGFAVAAIADRLKAKFSTHTSAVFVVALVGTIVYDFNYIKPGINTFEPSNKAYRSIAGKQTKVVALPFQLNSAHYFNSTFLTYALKYDLRLLTGHSSFYPKVVDAQVDRLLSLNDGIIDHQQWRWLRDNGYEYVVAHSTNFEPNVSATAVGALSISPYLEFVMFDRGVYLYRVREAINNEVGGGLKQINFEAWGRAIESTPSIIRKDETAVRHAFGWYDREAYPSQKPFRWMKETDSILALERNGTSRGGLSFDYRCPSQETIKINVYRVDAEVMHEQLHDGWVKANIHYKAGGDQISFVTLEASRIFEAPPDTRKFGCQVSDIVVH
jgi:hypothetical protein